VAVVVADVDVFVVLVPVVLVPVVLVPVVLVPVVEVPVVLVPVVLVPVMDELEVTKLVSLYISNLFPAPQYSYALPGQMKEQSVAGARIDPVLMVLPQ
jgi:hypothetical protein